LAGALIAMPTLATSWSQIHQLADSPAIHTLSLDIFDTLLRRRLAPEHYRFLRIAELICRELHQRGLERPRAEIFQARLLAADMIYRAARDREGDREGQHDRIVALQLQALDLPDSLAPLLIDLEATYEINAISPDTRVVALANRARQRGKRVILVTDMYLRAQTIATILQAHGLRELAEAVYVSSEVGMTKRCGGLFQHIIAHECRPAGGYLHLGDNYHADLLSARNLGWVAAWRPRPLLWRVINYGWNNVYRLYAAIT